MGWTPLVVFESGLVEEVNTKQIQVVLKAQLNVEFGYMLHSVAVGAGVEEAAEYAGRIDEERRKVVHLTLHLIVDLVADGKELVIDTILGRCELSDATTRTREWLHIRANGEGVDVSTELRGELEEIEEFAVTVPPVLLMFAAVGESCAIHKFTVRIAWDVQSLQVRSSWSPILAELELWLAILVEPSTEHSSFVAFRDEAEFLDMTVAETRIASLGVFFDLAEDLNVKGVCDEARDLILHDGGSDSFVSIADRRVCRR